MSETALRVLIVEDEIEIRRFVRMALEAEGLLVYEADSVQRGLIEAGTRRPDLIVLDLGLPDGDGVDLIRDLRTWSQIPIIVLSARSAESAKIVALDTGADDYLVKPFGTGELLARVRAQLRRSVKSTESTSIVTFGDVQIDMDRRIVERAGVPVHLTPLEYRLLTHLCAHQADTQYLRVFMGGLRKKIEADPSQPCHLLTETGVGYRFVP
jgi:two-component system KDP operon response regulator KdpE